ncbi:uncharacterized protein [Temnothorax longispinosus]|uniref:uncharacterized protein n=1 Tax=Temnothorax longispinosus TaxID=300112 RepID=UPI003A99821C
MAAQIRYINKISEICKELDNATHCPVCRKPSQARSVLYLEAHLFHIHKIFTMEGNFIWEDESDGSLWRYFTHEQKYIANCKICGRDICVYYKSYLQRHLNRHIKVMDKIREKINRCSRLSQHFTIDTENFKTNCKHCSWSIDTFDGRMPCEEQLIIHQTMCRNINEHSESDGGTGHYNVDATIQQPVTTENDASTSFHNDRHERRSENQEDQQSADIMAAQILYIKNIWEVCDKLPPKKGIYCYYCPKLLKVSAVSIEAHLFHMHNIFTTEGNFIWKDEIRNCSPWRYFTHDQKYIPNCIICGEAVRVYYKNHLERHLNRHIKMMDKIREKMYNCSVLSQHFTVDTENFKTNCKHCSWSIDTFDGRMQCEEHLKFHRAKCRNINKHSESDGKTGHYNVNATIQQPVTAGNYASTSFHNDRHERRSENQEDQQRPNHSRQQGSRMPKEIWRPYL